MNSGNKGSKVDIGIITIKEEEFTAITNRLGKWEPLKEYKHIYLYNIIDTPNGFQYRIAVARCLEPGTGNAQSIASDMIDELNPTWLFLVGIAGGVPAPEYSLGDVLLCTRLHDFSVCCITEDGSRSFADSGGPMHRMTKKLLEALPAYSSQLEDLEWNSPAGLRMERPTIDLESSSFTESLYGDDKWPRDVNESLRRNFSRSRKPKYLLGPTASSDSLVKSTSLLKTWLSCARDLKNVEMELAGVYRAAEGEDIPILAIRSLSDIVGYKRSPEWTQFACESAASFAICLIQSGVLDNFQATSPGKVKENAQMQSAKMHHKLPSPDILPEPGLFPLGSIPPFPRNHVFTGREDKLKELARILFYSCNSVNGSVLTGWRGVGKSQLAAEFSYRYGWFLTGVYWIQADQDICTGIAECGKAMSLSDWPDKLSEQVEATLRAWRVNYAHLIVLDNVESPQVLQDWMPRLLPSKILVTSFRTDWPADLGLDIMNLDVLTLEQSKKLLRMLATRLEKANDNELAIVADRLGCFPLALDVAGRYLKFRSDLSLENYLAELEKVDSALEHTSLKDWGNYSPTRHISPAATVVLSWEYLGDNEIDILAKRIFKMCGYCAPNAFIPRKLLAEAVGAEILGQQIDNALIRLDNVGLITLTDAGPRLHTLLAEFAYLQDQNAEENVLPALADGMITISNLALESGLLECMSPLREHLRVMAEATEKANLQAAGALWNNLGNHLKDIADYKDAKQFLNRAIRNDEKTYGPDHSKVAIDVNNLGTVLQDMGKPQEARKCFERALKIDEKNYGPDHPKVAIVINNLGTVLKDLTNFKEAKMCFEKALKINEKAYGLDHPKVAVDVNNLGTVLQILGEPQEARRCFERALKIDEKTYGLDHPKVALRFNNLGSVLLELKEPMDARKCFERALKIDEKIYGPDHPVVAGDINNKGTALRELGDLQEAKNCFERALKIYETVFGPNHFHVATTANNLGSVLLELREPTDARKCFERALKIDEKIYGPDHLYVAKSANNLGTVLLLIPDILGAKKYFRRALAIYEKALGPDHPTTKDIRRNLRYTR
jgi:tetratricopeptide (TPR) repeat protein/nucleoside phosphorylase